MKRSAPHDPKAAAARITRSPLPSHFLASPKTRTAAGAVFTFPPRQTRPLAAPWFGRPQERKKELGSIQGELEARRAAFVEREKESKRREAELEGRLAVAQAQLGEARAAAAREKEEQLDAVLAGSQAVSGILR